MESRRQKQISKEIQKEISDIFQKEGSNYYGTAFVTVTNVNITPDLLLARINLSVLNSTEQDLVIKQLNENQKDIRHKLGRRMKRLRRIPELQFFIDDTMEQVFKLEQIFKAIREDDPRAKDENESEGDEKE